MGKDSGRESHPPVFFTKNCLIEWFERDRIACYAIFTFIVNTIVKSE